MLAFPDYRSHPAYNFHPSHIKRLVETARFLPALVRSAVVHLKEQPFRPNYRQQPRSKVAMQFSRDGCLRFSLDPASVREIDDLTQPILQPWRAEHRSIPAETRTMWNAMRNLSRAEFPAFYEVLLRTLPSEIYEALSLLLGDAKLNLVQLTNFFDDDEPLFRFGAKQLTKYAPWHVDPIINTLKVIIYLTPVSETEGPFKYLRGSHLLNDSVFDRIVMHAHRFNALGQANWTWLNDDINRGRFAALPPRFQRKNTIGTDYLENWELLDSRQNDIQTFTGNVGTAVLFDPLGIHRGGTVTAGERVSLILSFSAGKS